MTQTKTCTFEVATQLVCRFRMGDHFSFLDYLTNEILPYIYTYIYIYILGSSARSARAHWAIVGPPGPLWAPLGTCGPHWALVGRALVCTPGPLWAGPL